MLRSGRQSVPTPLLLNSWPRPLCSPIEELPPSYEEIKSSVESTGDILIRIVTWNQQARPPPPPEEMAKLLFPCRKFHVVAVGTQECENSFAKSVVVPSKAKWEAALESALGTDYDVICSHSLQASHIILFVHKAIAHLVSNIRSMAVPTGIGDTLGNKGGIGVALSIAGSTFIFINGHLSAHQQAVNRRTREFRKISSDLATKVYQKHDSETSDLSGEKHCIRHDGDNLNDMNINENLIDDGDIVPDPDLLYPSSQYDDDLRIDSGPKTNPLVDCFDHVFWFGDLNFRISQTREVVEGLLENHMHDALLCNDQLTMLMRFNRIFHGFAEGPLNFFPTYKFDHCSDHYDSSQRRRVPSWTDRILFKSESNTQVLSYCSAPDVRTSDHRPVYATFRSRICFDENKSYEKPAWERKRETKSEVCIIS